MPALPPANGDPRADAIERAVLLEIAPDAETLARVAATRGRLVARVEEAARAHKIPLVRALVAGSAARGTFLKDRLDLDLFLLFPPSTARSDLERQGLELAGSVLSAPETRYAEHPYLRGTFDGFQVDAVPGYAIDDPSKPLSAVDRTPFHQAFLSERQSPAMVEQVRLTKQFLNALGVYGSEARTGGFSGYLVELLVLRFGSLRALLTAAQGWRIPVRLPSDPRANPRVPDDVALVIDDPVDPNRNVATALSRRNLALFSLAAGEYLRKPSESWFRRRVPPALSIERGRQIVRERGTHVSVVTLERPKLVDDILYPQLRKAERSLVAEAERLGFTVLGSSSAAGSDRLVVLLEFPQGILPAVRFHDGPPAGIDRVGQFLEKWTAPSAPVLQGPYVTLDGKLAVEARRTERGAETLLGEALERLPLGKDLKSTPTSSHRVESLGATSSTPELERALSDLLEKRLPWLRAPGA
ncbi:MAG: CCA tRNA nucleotidyltransferase [Thermoplasmata archaeon]|nr:CCA tRNA nucleotidyltransferase [Thermoplasmata archaeon]